MKHVKRHNCPFCYNRPVVESLLKFSSIKGEGQKPHYWVQCPECGVRGPVSKTINDSVVNWNKILVGDNNDI